MSFGRALGVRWCATEKPMSFQVGLDGRYHVSCAASYLPCHVESLIMT